jgi:hypothetical protein
MMAEAEMIVKTNYYNYFKMCRPKLLGTLQFLLLSSYIPNAQNIVLRLGISTIIYNLTTTYGCVTL